MVRTSVRGICGNEKCNRAVANGIECEGCGTWWHKTCSGIRPQTYQKYGQDPHLVWICKTCLELLKTRRNTSKTPGTVAIATPDFPSVNKTLAKVNARGSVASRTTATAEADVSPLLHTMAPGSKTYAQVVGSSPASAIVPSPKILTPKNTRVKVQSKRAGSLVDSHPVGRQDPGKTEDTAPVVLASIARLRKDIESRFAALENRNTPRYQIQNNVVIYGIDEPVFSEHKARYEYHYQKVRDILRLIGMNPGTDIYKVHRLGVFKLGAPPRPLLVAFKNNLDRDAFLIKGVSLSQRSDSKLKVMPDRGRGLTRKPVYSTSMQHTAETSQLGEPLLCLSKVTHNAESLSIVTSPLRNSAPRRLRSDSLLGAPPSPKN